MKKVYLTAVMVFALCTSAQALLLSPGGEVLTGEETSQSQINDALEAFGVTIQPLLYKAEADNGVEEEGLFADNYTTVFDPPDDPEDADITWDGPDFIDNPEYLLVKDGNQEPAWYLFDITAWDGMEIIELRDFWPENGAISHVSIYGGEDDGGGNGGGGEIPEPATMLLFGTGLVGLARMRRKGR